MENKQESLKEKVFVRAPASSANLGPGFDLCALALESPTCTVCASTSVRDELKVDGSFNPPSEMQQNKVFNVLEGMRHDFGISEKLEIIIHNAIPIGKGLGSSGACCAGVAVALDELFGLELSKERLVEYAVLGETSLKLSEINALGGARAAIEAGLVHLDNVSAAIFGGITIITSFNPLKVASLPFPDCELLLFIPNKGKPSTEFARKVLPEMVSRRLEIANRRNLAGLLLGVQSNDISAIASSLEEFIVEPARFKAGLLPNYLEVRKLAKSFGFGCAVSGAGPTILAIGEKSNERKAELVEGVKNIFAISQVGLEIIESRPSAIGARVV